MQKFSGYISRGNGKFTGTNDDIIRDCIGRIQESYDALIKVLHGKTQSDFIDKMAEEWACKYAQDYFNNFVEPSFNELL